MTALSPAHLPSFAISRRIVFLVVGLAAVAATL